MLSYIIRRVVLMIPTLVAISIVSFVIIQLPPGDYLTSMITAAAAQGETIDPAELARLRERYGLDLPVYEQYLRWMGNILLHGDFGYSFQWNRPVSELLGQRVFLTALLSYSSILFVWAVALPLGIYAAVRKYSWGDYLTAAFGFIGLATPDFMLALVLMYVMFAFFNQSVGGLFSPQFVDAPWSLAKAWDLLKHIWIPMIILGTNGVASLTRIMRANLLDELHKPYVLTARAKGLSEPRLILKYPTRIAINPFISGIGGLLPAVLGGETIVAVVLSLPTTGPLLLNALMSQDMYLAGSIILITSTLAVIGVLLSDLVLAWVDPRIRYER